MFASWDKHDYVCSSRQTRLVPVEEYKERKIQIERVASYSLQTGKSLFSMSIVSSSRCRSCSLIPLCKKPN